MIHCSFFAVGRTLWLGWLLHYLPFFFMARQLFLHHYLPAAAFRYVVDCAKGGGSLLYNRQPVPTTLALTCRAFCVPSCSTLLLAHMTEHVAIELFRRGWLYRALQFGIMAATSWSFYHFAPLTYVCRRCRLLRELQPAPPPRVVAEDTLLGRHHFLSRPHHLSSVFPSPVMAGD
jgi:dolichyl-phosphate-mannose--protein O-mannosyl transferase